MSVMLQILFNSEPWFQLFGAALGTELEVLLGPAFGNLLGDAFRFGVGLLGGAFGGGGFSPFY